MPAWAEPARAGLRVAALALLVAGAAGSGQAQTSDLVSKSALRVCADPAADPMSMKDGSGYENRLAELFAEKLGRPVSYTWFPMATGFIRQTLKAGRCDVVMGYAQGHELVLNTNHYMTSAYVLVVPEDGPLAGVTTLSDPALQGRKLGVIAGSPPATHMARHGLIGKARPYALVVDRRVESPASDMLDDLAAGEIDAAVLWGPIGGPLVKRDHPGLKVTPLINEAGAPKLFYRITMGVRQGEKVWQRQLNSLIRRNQSEIDALLTEAGVPLLDDMGARALDVGQ
ncbi:MULTISPECIES: substrate-binding domain-containing protein [unclassified Salipiger]|uniref:substrate-binding domain-containing protein n=1 Tax=unclassified Salipiger TaxID=2640570 RepID=UPI0013BE1F28|nr:MULTISPECIES: substrate-binding domain-containing protein [unclassified Salipiger]NDV52714.1 quinoprotein dehydrogenase-associated putative ABC transporter substrate-binding protein [Salipiger sp. PrR003]NDW34292.1 quinoprotein dehydrogenase-associated putative ABC transporter substrate-binding protein [Salipiger sp. PrR007]